MFEKFKRLLEALNLKSIEEAENWNYLLSEDEVDRMVEASRERVQLVFKHSPRCMISSQAWNKLKNLHSQLEEKGSPADLYIVDVVRARAVSDYIEEKSGVKHESPQVMLWNQGKVETHYSHTNINAGTLVDWIHTMNS